MFPALIASLSTAIMGALNVVVLVLCCRIIEEKIPAERDHARRDVLLDYKLVGLNIAMKWLAQILLMPVMIWLINVAGGGLIRLRADGVWMVLSAIVWLLINDFIKYWMHRLQHAVPCLWAMHSLHHSATAMTGSTGARHYWFEQVISLLLVIPLIGAIFNVPMEILSIVTPIQFAVAGFSHANIRASGGRLICGPQFHRIHHSCLAAHFDKNFAEVLPLWDVLFGTWARPKPGEYPPTGLPDRSVPRDVLEGLIWPFRGALGHRNQVTIS
jgi:sterol desaturase/sphingolipid hydroxylase (fatty acid hydroxylase superfamily)